MFLSTKWHNHQFLRYHMYAKHTQEVRLLLICRKYYLDLFDFEVLLSSFLKKKWKTIIKFLFDNNSLNTYF